VWQGRQELLVWPPRSLERRTAERAGVGRVRHVLADARMAGQADFQAGIFTARDRKRGEEGVAVKSGNGGGPGQIGGPCPMPPTGPSGCLLFLKDLIITGWAVPSDAHAVGEPFNTAS